MILISWFLQISFHIGHVSKAFTHSIKTTNVLMPRCILPADSTTCSASVPLLETKTGQDRCPATWNLSSAWRVLLLPGSSWPEKHSSVTSVCNFCSVHTPMMAKVLPKLWWNFKDSLEVATSIVEHNNYVNSCWLCSILSRHFSGYNANCLINGVM